MEAGKDVQNSVIDNIISRQQPYECAVLVYTVSSINSYCYLY